MKNTMKLTAAVLLALSLAACGQKEAASTTTASAPAAQAQAPAANSAEQAKADYAKLIAWTEKSQQEQQQFQADVQAAQAQLQGKSKEEVAAEMGKFKERLTAIAKSLDEVQVSSPEIVEYKKLNQEALAFADEAFQFSIEGLLNPESVQAKQKEMEEKMKAFMPKAEALQKMALELDAKYGAGAAASAASK